MRHLENVADNYIGNFFNMTGLCRQQEICVWKWVDILTSVAIGPTNSMSGRCADK